MYPFFIKAYKFFLNKTPSDGLKKTEKSLGKLEMKELLLDFGVEVLF